MNQQPIAQSAKTFQDSLNNLGLCCKVLEFSSSTKTAIDAANSLACEVAQIVKSIIFKTKNTEKPVLVLASGPNRINEKQIELLVDEKIVKADADFVKQVTGFVIGGVPPICHKTRIEFIFIDKSLLKFDEVWAAAGTPNAVFCIKSNDLLNHVEGKVIEIDQK